jgi:hypothetical protein
MRSISVFSLNVKKASKALLVKTKSRKRKMIVNAVSKIKSRFKELNAFVFLLAILFGISRLPNVIEFVA